MLVSGGPLPHHYSIGIPIAWQWYSSTVIIKKLTAVWITNDQLNERSLNIPPGVWNYTVTCSDNVSVFLMGLQSWVLKRYKYPQVFYVTPHLYCSLTLLLHNKPQTILLTTVWNILILYTRKHSYYKSALLMHSTVDEVTHLLPRVCNTLISSEVCKQQWVLLRPVSFPRKCALNICSGPPQILTCVWSEVKPFRNWVNWVCKATDLSNPSSISMFVCLFLYQRYFG